MHAFTHSTKWTNWKYLIVVAILLLGLAGCSPANEENTNTPLESISDVDESVSDVASSVGDIASEDQDVVITFSYEENWHDVIEPLIEAFNEENPSITVLYVPLLEEDFNASPTVEDRLLMLASSADTTLTWIRSPYIGNYFLDLQPLIDSDSAFDPADFWNGTLAGMEDTEGRILGLPMMFFLQGIFYNTAAFDAAGQSYPQPGWTWDDFRSAAAALSQNERYGFADSGYASILRPLIGYDLALNDGEINAEALATELEWYLQMANEDQILAMRSSDDLLRAQFSSGNPPAMWAGSLSDLALGYVTGEPEAATLTELFTESAYSYAPFPVDMNGEQLNTTPIFAVYGAISRGSEHPLEAWKWLNFLSEHGMVSDPGFASNQLHIPARQSVAEATGFWENYPLEVQAAMQYGLEHAWFASLYPQAENEILDTIKQVVVLNSSLKSALEDVEAQQASWPQETPDVPEISIAAPPEQDNLALGTDTINFYYTPDNPQWLRTDAAMEKLIQQFNRDHKDEIFVKTGTTLKDGESYLSQRANNYDCFLAQLVTADGSWTGPSELTLNLTPLMEAEDAAFQQDFDPYLLDIVQYDGGLYALPISNQPEIMAYNADLVDERGLEPPSPDWTFDEYLALLTAVSSSSGSDPVYGSYLYSYKIYFAGRGVQWLDTSGDFPVARLDTPEMLDTVNWLSQLVQSGVLTQAAYGDLISWDEITNSLTFGNIGIWTVDAGDQQFYGRPLQFNVGIVPFPNTDKLNASIARNNTKGFYISKQTEYPEACWELGKYISESIESMYGVPARISVANSTAWEAYVGAENAEIYRAAIARNLADGESDLYESYLESYIYSWLNEATYNILIFGNDPAQELAQAQQYADAYLACMVPYDGLNLNSNELREASVSCTAQVDPD